MRPRRASERRTEERRRGNSGKGPRGRRGNAVGETERLPRAGRRTRGERCAPDRVPWPPQHRGNRPPRGLVNAVARGAGKSSRDRKATPHARRAPANGAPEKASRPWPVDRVSVRTGRCRAHAVTPPRRGRAVPRAALRERRSRSPPPRGARRDRLLWARAPRHGPGRRRRPGRADQPRSRRKRIGEFGSKPMRGYTGLPAAVACSVARVSPVARAPSCSALRVTASA